MTTAVCHTCRGPISEGQLPGALSITKRDITPEGLGKLTVLEFCSKKCGREYMNSDWPTDPTDDAR